MEAPLKSKPKKLKSKSKTSSKLESDTKDNKTTCDIFIKEQGEKSCDVNSEKTVNLSATEVEHPVSIGDELSSSVCEKNIESCSENKLEPILNLVEQDISAEISNFKPENSIEKLVTDVQNCLTLEISNPENAHSIETHMFLVTNLQRNVEKTHLQNIYPDLKTLQHCEQIHNILTSQTLVKTETEKFKNKTAMEANKAFHDFTEVLKDVDKQPLMDMVQEYQRSQSFDSSGAQQLLLALYLILSPVPLKDFFLRNIGEEELADTKFTVIDSEGEEEESCEMSKKFSDADILSLLNQIPIRGFFKNLLFDEKDDSEKLTLRMLSEGEMLKLFAYSTAIIDVLFNGLETYYSENLPLLFEAISNLIRHILLYISKYWTHHVNENGHFKSEIQAVYDRLFFHVVFKVYKFEKAHIWKILPALPYHQISGKMFWNIMWIFFSPGKPEEQIYSEKDVEIKIKDECFETQLINHIKNLPVHDIYQLLNTFKKMIESSSAPQAFRNQTFCDKDFMKFSFSVIFNITVLEPSLYNTLSNEGFIILKDIIERFPFLMTVLLQKIDSNDDLIANNSINLLKKMNLLSWIPEDSDLRIISSWLTFNLNDSKNKLARLILENMNWEYNEEGLLFLAYELHKQIAAIVCEVYVKFDAENSNERLVSKGVKQMLQFTSLGNQREEEEFVQWAWNILFSLKLHPLDRKHPPYVEVYDGHVECNKPEMNSNYLESVLSAYKTKHPTGCYLMLVMSNEGHSVRGLLSCGLDCFSSLVCAEQYMAAIKCLYYIMPFFVKNSDELLDRIEFIKALSSLIAADLGTITFEPIIGAVLHKVAAMIKYQIYQAAELTVECATPLLKLWVKVLMKVLYLADSSLASILKNSVKQIHFLLDVCVKISFLHDYTRECMLDLLSSYCNPLILPKAPMPSFWNRMFSTNSSVYTVLKTSVIPEFPWLAWFVLYSEMIQKNVEDMWFKVSSEVMKDVDGFSASCLKKVSQTLKIDIEFLPIYRWAVQAVETPVSHPVLPLIWQQFFIYFFERVPVSNSDKFVSLGLKYFKVGEFSKLLQKMKKCLSDTEKYYRNLHRKHILESESVEASEDSLGNGAKSLLYSNLEKLFQAFQLWIEDESLQHGRLCLSALEPKYCTYRLELIFSGNKEIWFDMVSYSSLNSEINQKVHPWSFKKRVTSTNKIFECHAEKEEPLSQLLMRHIERYETILPFVISEPISVTAFEKKDMSLTSKHAVVQVIEQNQFIIFDKAHFFCEQMKKLKQLNFNFINWTPQEYDIEDCEITQSKVCHKGTGGNGCSGAAFFRLQIQKCKKNERISERIEMNRADYVIIEDQISKLPVKDLCMATLRIENCIRSLALKIKEAKGEDVTTFKKMGIALFYHEISVINKTITSIADYPPSRQFFSIIIETLGGEFLDGNDTELLELAKSILSHPESGSLALPLFNPNKSDIKSFLDVYKILTSSVGSSQSANILIALFSKIDLPQWLNEHSPSFDERNVLFDNICEALFLCGQKPSTEILPLFDILKRHFTVVLRYMFPDLFLAAVYFLLKGIEDGNLCVDVYYDAFHCFGCPLFNEKTTVEDVEFALKKFAENQLLPADQKIFVSVAQLNLQQVLYVSHKLYDHFMTKRSSFDLYKRYGAYIQPLGIFIAIMSHSLVALHLDEISNTNEPMCISEVWKTFHMPYCPWLHPVVNNSSLHFPWTEQELDNACFMFQIFRVSLKYFHGQVLNLQGEESVLSCMWSCYVQIYVTPGYRHYFVSFCHNEFLNLPWHEFYPRTQDIEGMCKVLQSNLHESKEFLAKMSLKIPWADVMQIVSSTKSPDYIGKVLATLGKLLIISQLNSTASENIDLNVFKEVENLSWQYVSMDDINLLLELFYLKVDSFLLISNWNKGPEFHVLQLLKLVCCMIPNPGNEEYSNSKRIVYLKKFISTFTSYCSSKTTQVLKYRHHVSDIISNLLDEINLIVCSVTNPNEKINYSLPLLKETVILLNDIPKGELDSTALNSMTSWLSINKRSPLLLPCLKISCENLNSVSHMVSLIECCISTRFRDETLDVHETLGIWHLISSYFSVDSNIFQAFVTECVKKNAYLTLYCCILHKLPHSVSTENRKKLLEQISKWIKESELSCEAEAKFILLWDKLLDLCIKLVSEQEGEVVRSVLTSFCWVLETYAQDRSNNGFFAIIGLGHSSSLSVNFRFLSRVMIAFIQYQVPSDRPIRIEPTDMESSDSNLTSASCASKALDNLKALQLKKSYSALQSQIDYAVKCVLDPKYTLLHSRELLKYFAAVLYPKDSYLSVLDA